MTGLVPPPGATVRVKKNDGNVPIGSEGLVAYIHPESRLPVVKTESGRPVALLPDQLEVLSMSAMLAPDPVTDCAERTGKAWNWSMFDSRTATVTLNPASLKLSATAAELLSGAERVHLLYDRDRKAIALQPTKETGRSVRLTRNTAGCSISARDFLKLIDFTSVRQGSPLRLPATWDASAGLLIVTGVPFRQG